MAVSWTGNCDFYMFCLFTLVFELSGYSKSIIPECLFLFYHILKKTYVAVGAFCQFLIVKRVKRFEGDKALVFFQETYFSLFIMRLWAKKAGW